MEYRYLGRTGLRVSSLCLGATMFEFPEAAPGEHRRMLDHFVAEGGNFFDTADIYGRGDMETSLGQWLKDQDRDAVVVGTKVGFALSAESPGAPVGSERPNDEGLSRKHLMAAVEASLRRLQTDHLDLYTVHAWDPGTPLLETLSTLDRLVQQGKIRYFGLSNWCGWQLQKAVDLCRQHGLEPVAGLQALYNLLDRESEWELLPACREEGVGFTAWSPLRGGWLGGRLRRGMSAPPDDSKVARAGHGGWDYATERTWSILDELEAVADALGRSSSEVALRWVLQRPGVTAPVVGPRTTAQLESCLRAVGWTLPDDAVARLDEVSAVALPYPYDLQWRIAHCR